MKEVQPPTDLDLNNPNINTNNPNINLNNPYINTNNPNINTNNPNSNKNSPHYNVLNHENANQIDLTQHPNHEQAEPHPTIQDENKGKIYQPGEVYYKPFEQVIFN